MFKVPACKTLFNSLVFISFSLLSLLLPALTAQAQFGSPGIDDDRSSGMRQGANTIVGQVVFPNGQQPERRCTVRLSSVRVGEFSTLTDENGVFTFRRLREGSYFITVQAGKDYLPAQETVDLYDNRPRTTTVQIELRLRPSATTKPAVVNALFAGVPKAAVELYQKGVAAAAAGRDKEAIEELKAAVALHPAFVQALNELSALYLNGNDFQSAEEALSAALKVDPNNTTLRLNYGYVLLLRERFVEAERELHRAIELKDESFTAHLYRGRVLIRLGRLDDAEKELNRALSLAGSSSSVVYRYLGALYSERGEKSKAVEALKKYLKLTPGAKDAAQVQAIINQLQQPSVSKD